MQHIHEDDFARSTQIEFESELGEFTIMSQPNKVDLFFVF